MLWSDGTNLQDLSGACFASTVRKLIHHRLDKSGRAGDQYIMIKAKLELRRGFVIPFSAAAFLNKGGAGQIPFVPPGKSGRPIRVTLAEYFSECRVRRSLCRINGMLAENPDAMVDPFVEGILCGVLFFPHFWYRGSGRSNSKGCPEQESWKSPKICTPSSGMMPG